MSRPGVTKQDVFAVANRLLGDGKAPTIEQIRQILKTGSNSTIAAHLRDWRAAQNSTQTLALNEGLPQDIVAIVKGLWDRLSAQAGLKVDEVETNATQAIAEIQQELQKYKTNNQRWQRLFMQWQQDKERLVAEKLQLEQTVEILSAKNKVQKEQIQEKRMRIEELHRLHLHGEACLEQLRRAMQNQVNLLQTQLAVEQVSNKNQLNETKRIIKELRAQNKLLNKENTKLKQNKMRQKKVSVRLLTA